MTKVKSSCCVQLLQQTSAWMLDTKHVMTTGYAIIKLYRTLMLLLY